MGHGPAETLRWHGAISGSHGCQEHPWRFPEGAFRIWADTPAPAREPRKYSSFVPTGFASVGVAAHAVTDAPFPCPDRCVHGKSHAAGDPGTPFSARSAAIRLASPALHRIPTMDWSSLVLAIPAPGPVQLLTGRGAPGCDPLQRWLSAFLSCWSMSERSLIPPGPRTLVPNSVGAGRRSPCCHLPLPVAASVMRCS